MTEKGAPEKDGKRLPCGGTYAQGGVRAFGVRYSRKGGGNL